MASLVQARDVAAAFLTHFLDSNKRTTQNTDAFLVYAPNSIARITRELSDNRSEEITLNGVEEITQHCLTLPPSALTLSSYDALPIVDGAILIQATGTEVIDITDYPWSRSMVLVPTPQGGFYLKSDLLHYHLGSDLPTTTETIEVVIDQVKPIKKLREIRQQKPKRPIDAAPVESIPVAVVPVVEVAPTVIPTPEPVVVQPVVEVVEIAPVVKAPVPAPVAKPTNAKPLSWAKLFVNGTAEPVAVFSEQKEKKTRNTEKTDKVEKKPVTAAPAAPVTPPKVSVPKDESKMALVKGIEASVSRETLFLFLSQLGGIEHLQYEAGKPTAAVYFETKEDAQNAITVGKLQLSGGAPVSIVGKQQKPSSQNAFRQARR